MSSPPHGILKPNVPPREEKPATIAWDEKVIAEHDLERGTRQHIDEPKTPYVGPQDSPPIEFDVMDFSLNGRGGLKGSVASEGSSHQEIPSQDSKVPNPASGKQDVFMAQVAEALATQADEDRKKQEFLQKRKLHYNEGLLFKNKIPSDDDEEESD